VHNCTHCGMDDRFAFAAHAPMLLARFLDHFEVNRLRDSVTEICHGVIGSRRTVVLAPEIALVSRALYYSCSILGFGVTPGQALCDFALVGMGPRTHGTSKSAVSKATKSRLYSVIALYALLPYVYERKSLLWSNVSTMLEIVATPEPGLLSPGFSLQSAAADSTTARPDGRETDEGQVNSRSGDVTEGQPIDSFLTKILRAIAGSVATISSSGTERVEALCSFLSDVHKFLFFQYGRLATSVFSSITYQHRRQLCTRHIAVIWRFLCGLPSCV
jgi:hypothetical protein